VRVEVEPANSDVTFAADDPSVAAVRLTHEGVVVGGEGAGTTVVRATSGDAVVAELVVSVKDAREEVVSFFYVSDSSDPSFSTSRDHEKATLLTLRLNRVWRRQANVRFSLGGVTDVVVSEPIGPAVGAGGLEKLVPYATPGTFNVFFVWRLADGVEPVRVAGRTGEATLMVLPDDDCPDGMDVTHGAGHHLGHSFADAASGLMATCGQDTDRRRVRTELAHLVNPTRAR
jgi:hypothetical protein